MVEQVGAMLAKECREGETRSLVARQPREGEI